MSAVSESTMKSPAGLIGSPSVLLLVTGTLIGFNFPLGKIAGEAAVSPFLWAMLLSVGASALLLPFLFFKGHLNLPRGRLIRYIVFSALISFVLPNVLLFAVIPHVGAGYAGLMFALSPVFTLTMAAMFRMRTPNHIGLLGIALGLIGAAVVSITRGAAPEAPPLVWLLAALAVPFSLACGNIYRSLDWPEGALPDVLAFWSHAFAVVLFVGLLFFLEGEIPVTQLETVPWAALAQMIGAGLTFPVFFRLQQRGGPVLLSQIGYVAAAVGLGAGTILMGESYSLTTWIGAAVIGVGIAVTILAQRKA
ncbi:DMT family transporter [Aestuariispira insulae]|uniref:EamA-like transporter family protein n=1 Tax=Aestuariispira insulae TaxID=1461337 RepID=A0A3D9HQ11_9PROT|nr:DMT family transporter [Aestuariispira insulae]RED51604.1 EamA-like transporter family protein [Aestuariispira insulae]